MSHDHKITEHQGLKRSIEFTISAADYQKHHQRALEQQVKNAPKQKGFRKGKMSTKALQQMSSKKDREALSRDIINFLFQQYCHDNGINTAPESISFELPTIEKNAQIECKIEFEIMPEVKLTDMKKVTLERLAAEVDEASIDTSIENLQQQFATWETKQPADAPAEKGDQVNINFLGSTAEDGEFKGGKAEGFELELGAGQMIDGFDEGICGMHTGEERTIDVTFPDPYHAKELAGKAAQFKITLNSIKSRNIPVVDEELIKKAGIADGSVESLRAELKTHLRTQLDKVIYEKLKKQVLEQLRQHNSLELPEALVKLQIQHLQQQTLQRIAQQTGGKIPPDLPLDTEHFKQQAETQVHNSILLSKIIENEQLEVDEAGVHARLKEIATSYERPQELLEYYHKNPQAKREIAQAVLEDKAIQWVVDHASVTDKQVSFEEATKADTN